jgi:hypothetical protein
MSVELEGSIALSVLETNVISRQLRQVVPTFVILLLIINESCFDSKKVNSDPIG